jgi:hypothetical protein
LKRQVTETDLQLQNRKKTPGPRGATPAQQVDSDTGSPRAQTAGPAVTPSKGAAAAAAPVRKREQEVVLADAQKELPRARTSPQFSTVGRHKQQFCDTTTVLHARWVAPSNQEKPDGDRYRPEHKLVSKKSTEWDFAKLQERSKGTISTGYERELSGQGIEYDHSPFASTKLPSSILDASRDSFASTSTGFQNLSKYRAEFMPKSPMRRQQTRDYTDWGMETWLPKAEMFGKKAKSPGRTWLSCRQPQHLGVSEPPEDLLVQDKKTSAVHKQPSWEIGTKVMGRTWNVAENFFEPGKYGIAPEQQSSPKSGPSHGKVLHRTEKVATRQVQKSILDSEDPKKGIVYNRSLYRNAPIARPRTTHVMHMHKNTDRPDLFGSAPTYFNPNDPVAVAETFEREMSLDSSTIDRVVTPSVLIGPGHHRIANRNVSVKGSRSTLDIPAYLMFGSHDEHENDALSVEAHYNMKENPMRHNFMTTVPIGKVTGRSKNASINVSSLRKPREMAFGDFERTPPVKGFTTRMLRSSHGPRVRSFEALPEFDATLYDEESGEDHFPPEDDGEDPSIDISH